jgi:KipI family sensor histidine kinase inhibitor
MSPSTDGVATHFPAIEVLGDDALLLRFGSSIDAGSNARVHRWARRIERERPHWLRDIVPAYASLALFVDVLAFPKATDPLVEATRWLRRLQSADGTETRSIREREIEIPVEYGGEHGPDLDALAAHAGLPAGDVVARHVAAEYTVAMLGFAPGFPYLLGLDPVLAMPRLSTPRTRVAAGSVGIGGVQTGIYPRSGPGGWQIIGRTNVALFDPARDPPSLLAPGDRVRFVAIDPAT